MREVLSSLIISIIGNGLWEVGKKLILKEENLNENELKIIDSKIDDKIIAKPDFALVNDRLKYIFDNLNQAEYGLNNPSQKISKRIGLNYIDEFDKYLTGERQLDFYVITKLCDVYGVSENWLINGEGRPFMWNRIDRELYPASYAETICKLNPDKIYFTRNKTECAESGFILEFGEKYIVSPRSYHISSYVGGTGSTQIKSFYKLINNVLDKGMGAKCRGVFLDKEQYLSLFIGNVYPGIIRGIDTNNWWKDFLDYQFINESEEMYSKNYDTELVKAMKILQSKM